MAEQIPIDERYTYQFDNGNVQILRHGEPWLGEEPGGFPGSKAWISVANEIEKLRKQVEDLQTELAEPDAPITTEHRSAS